jgi:hypothetical protein
MHRCMPIIRIAVHGYAHRGDKGTHGMCAYFLQSCAWVSDCVVDMRALMCIYVCDRGAWRCPCMADRHALMSACGMNRHACVCPCGVNRRAYVCACGVNIRALEARMMGAKMCFMVKMVDLRLYYVVAGDHLYDVSPLARVGLVAAKGCRGY